MILVDLKPDLQGDARTFFSLLVEIFFRGKINKSDFNRIKFSIGKDFSCNVGIIVNYDITLYFLYLDHGTEFINNGDILTFRCGDLELTLPQSAVKKISYVPVPNTKNPTVLWP